MSTEVVEFPLPAHLASTSTIMPTDIAWQLGPGANESHTFYLTTREPGTYAIVQLIYSAMGLSPSVQSVGRFYKGTSRKAKTLVTSKLTTTSADKISAKSDTMTINFTPADNGAFGSFHVVFKAEPKFIFDFTFECGAVPGFQINDGRHHFVQENPSAGFVVSKFLPKCVVSGSIQVDSESFNVQGSGLFIHAIHNKPQAIKRWSFLNLQNDTDALLIYQFELPSGKNYTLERMSQAALVHNNKRIAVTLNNTVKMNGKEKDSVSGYDIPSSVEYMLTGTTEEGGLPVTISLKSPLSNRVDRIDVLAELPYLLRMFIATFVTAPWVYQWFEQGVADVTIGADQKFQIKGSVFMEKTFMMS